MEEIKHLLPQTKYFKANLHTHTTISDGKLSPQEVKQAYKAQGYNIICLTDHNVIVDHSDMNDPDFLMLTGMELNVNASDKSAVGGQTYHLNLISKKPNNLWSPAKVFRRYPGSAEYEDKMQCENMDLQCNPYSINAMIEKANEKGFLVMYNHPTWSCQSYPDYASLKGLWGLELRNTECCLLGHNENNFRVYKDLLTLGKKVYPIGADDMHSPKAIGKSWIMLGASALNYENVIDALEKGDFYMSCGPEITSLSVENNILKVTCSDAKQINIESQGRLAKSVFAENSTLREAEFQLDSFFTETMEDKSFIYVTIIAPDGSYATTRPYYLKELK